jgi:hypothetical protein
MDELVPDEGMSSGAPPPCLGCLVLWLLLVAVLTAFIAWDWFTRWNAAEHPQGTLQVLCKIPYECLDWAVPASPYTRA